MGSADGCMVFVESVGGSRFARYWDVTFHNRTDCGALLF